MEMCYDGALVMPSSYAVMSNDEMVYTEGGRVYNETGTAKQLKQKASVYMASWFSLAGGYTYTAAAAVASAVGVGVGVIAGIGAGYCTFAANEYRKAYNYFSGKSQSSKKKYIMQTISFLAFITGVNYKAK